MRINNNIAAINTHRQYGINNTNVSKSTEKLSSGYRINRAGDDAAGLAISEKMRAQIRGLTMASKNSQDAISLVQTAEGALQESHNILQRMRELAVQSASDTNETTIDRGALEQEFQQLIKELDDTANKTRFNDQNLIDGTFQAAYTKLSAATGYGKYSMATDGTVTTNTTYDRSVAAGNYTHIANYVAADKTTVVAGAKADVVGTITASKITALEINTSAFTIDPTNRSIADVKLIDVVRAGDNENEFELTFEVATAEGSATVVYKYTHDPATGTGVATAATDFGVTMNLTTQSGTTSDELFAELEKIKGVTSTTAVAAVIGTATLAQPPKVTAAYIGGGVGTLGETSQYNGTYTLAVAAGSDLDQQYGMNFQLLDSDGNVVAEIKGAAASGDLTSGAAGNIALNFGQYGTVTLTGTANHTMADWQTAAASVSIEIKNGVSEVQEGDDAYYSIRDTNSNEIAKVKEGDTGYVGKDGIRIDFGKAVTKADLLDATAMTAFLGGSNTATIAITDVQGKSLTIQTGANQGDDLQINIDKMDAWNLGVSFSSVKDLESAQNAITEVNNAINQVSTQRAALGALQNRLDHKIANLDTSAENLTSAESRIRDIDMAKEMTNFTKNNILFQASTAMLAQANAMPQGVLQLLG